MRLTEMTFEEFDIQVGLFVRKDEQRPSHEDWVELSEDQDETPLFLWELARLTTQGLLPWRLFQHSAFKFDPKATSGVTLGFCAETHGGLRIYSTFSWERAESGDAVRTLSIEVYGPRVAGEPNTSELIRKLSAISMPGPHYFSCLIRVDASGEARGAMDLCSGAAAGALLQSIHSYLTEEPQPPSLSGIIEAIKSGAPLVPTEK